MIHELFKIKSQSTLKTILLTIYKQKSRWQRIVPAEIVQVLIRIVLHYDLIMITVWPRLTLKFHELEEVLILGPFLFLDFDEFLQIDFFKLHLLQ